MIKTYSIVKKYVPDPPIYNWFYVQDISGQSNVLRVTSAQNAPSFTIEISTNGLTWATLGTLSGYTVLESVVPANGKVYMRANTQTWGQIYITCDYNYNVGGDILSLLYGSNYDETQTSFPSQSTTFGFLFSNSTTLVSAEDLVLAQKVLTPNAYEGMFNSCSSLSSITCLATDVTATDCTKWWVTAVAQSGTFYKDPSMSSWTTGINGIPSGWTVADYSA